MITPSKLTPADELVSMSIAGDEAASDELFGRYRSDLRRLFHLSIDDRLQARADASDLIQDTLAVASRRLPQYAAQEQQVDFYTWLKSIAWERLIDLQRRHVVAQRRTVNRETRRSRNSATESVAQLMHQVCGGDPTPSEVLIVDEMHSRIQRAMLKMADTDREILNMRYLEQMKIAEIAEAKQLNLGATKMRCLRAVERLRSLLDSE